MKTIIFLSFALVGSFLLALHQSLYYGIVVLVVFACLVLALYDYLQESHSIMRNFPVMGRLRYVAEWFRPKMQQYFVEGDTEGRPFSRIYRSIIYQRAKNVLDTSPFGTLLNVYDKGYEWMDHSIAALSPDDLDEDPRIQIGGRACSQPYSSSLLNVSAMSYGSLSKNAVLALNAGAQMGGFAQNTGEGGVSDHHLKYGGDLIYQMGTGYFGCRNDHGGFSPERFEKLAGLTSIKMIEIKLSQGAKPGHGGILPAKKVTPEIARIRNIPLGRDVVSPPSHSAFSTPLELLGFVKQLRSLSKGKPIGIKLCIGHKVEFVSICKAMVELGIRPDFIAIDGGEGGTGAAPLEFSNSVGMPLKEGLAFAYDALLGFDLKSEIKLLATGKIVTGFHMFRALALGADACYSARAMMMALGCIQALECNKNTCPVGVTSQNPTLVRGLKVDNKKERVAEFHAETIKSFVELLAASGLPSHDRINRSHIHRRIENNLSQTYDEIYPYITKGCLLDDRTIPDPWRPLMTLSTANSFQIKYQIAYES